MAHLGVRSKSKSDNGKKYAKAIKRDVNGCYSIIGPVEICWALNVSEPSASISLKIFGNEIISGEVNADSPCLSLEGDVGLASADIDICLDVAGKKITAAGEACAAIVGCTEFDVTLIGW